jgi:hypothetical protein
MCAMALNAKLVVVAGDTKTTEINLKLPTTIGRGRGTPIVLPHPLVSRQHCELYEADGRIMVRDLGSLNGTFVNNQRITESALGPGELLTVGTVTFRAVYEAEEPSGSGSGGKGKAGKSDKTVREEKTVQATKSKPGSPKQQAQEPAEASSDSEVIEFNFEQPLMPPEADDVQVTQRIDAKKKPPAKAPAKEEKKPSSSSDDDLADFLESLDEE